MSVLEIKNLHVSVEGKEILKGVSFKIKSGEVVGLLGPNGNGKSTLFAAIMGNPKYKVLEGEVLLDGVNLLNLSVDERIKCEKLGLLVKSTNETFLFSLYPLPKWSDWKTAKARSGNQMPTQKQWLIIKQNRSKTQNALDAFGGGKIDNRRYWNSGDTPTWTTFFL